MNTHKVKIMADGLASDVNVEGNTYSEAADKVYKMFDEKNAAGRMMSEEVVIFNEFGLESYKIKNILCE